MIKNDDRIGSRSIAILSAWAGILFILYTLCGVSWFRLGDFGFRTAMAYHGILIPAWMMLVWAYSQHVAYSYPIRKWLGIGAVSACVLTGAGSILIHDQGFSPGTNIQVTGMILAEITALAIIIGSFRHHFRTGQGGINAAAWWTASVALIGLSLSTPLGHLAGAVKDLGMKFPIFAKHAALLGIPPEDVLNGYIGSHSHQILAAFLAAGFAAPLIQKTFRNPNIGSFMEKTGLLIMTTSTIAQIALYQYCAWFGWEPPDLFSNETNGLPLDDFILVILGLGMLFLIPGLWKKSKNSLTSKEDSQLIGKIITFFLIAYMISVVALGLYIEFHEQYFGHGEGSAPGVLHDQAYIRAHLLYGFIIIPIVLSALLNINLLNTKKQKWLIMGLAILVITTGFAGVLTWTFFLNSLILKISFVLTPVFLLAFASQLASAGNVFHSVTK